MRFIPVISPQGAYKVSIILFYLYVLVSVQSKALADTWIGCSPDFDLLARKRPQTRWWVVQL